MEIKEINVTDLIVDDYNVRKGEWDEDEDFIESIKNQGVLEPLLVRKDEKGLTHLIVCGNRRWHAAIDAGLKKVPCVIREMSNLEAIGISLQENLQRNNLDRVQEAEGIAKMWEMLNGERTYEQKMSEMKKGFGLSKSSVERYLSVSRLSDTIKEKFLKSDIRAQGLDTDTASGIATETDWDDTEKEEAAEILSDIESADERRKTLSKMKEHDDLSPKEAYEKVKKVKLDRKFIYFMPGSIVKQFDEACQKIGLSDTEALTEAVKQWLIKGGFDD